MSKYLTLPPDCFCPPPVPHLAIGLHVCVVAGRPQPAVERRLRHPHEVERRREDLREFFSRYGSYTHFKIIIAINCEHR